ncbi:hypothetical protein FSCOSCO3_A018470 [Scomber scombrus]|uniref:Zinc finger PHD-type domain-containing protein n=1 Tax=Scomber scombrus TaxID=13677 RepID=A0AAV1PEM1_SCOSC
MDTVLYHTILVYKTKGQYPANISKAEKNEVRRKASKFVVEDSSVEDVVAEEAVSDEVKRLDEIMDIVHNNVTKQQEKTMKKQGAAKPGFKIGYKICYDMCQRWYHHECVQRPPVDEQYLCLACKKFIPRLSVNLRDLVGPHPSRCPPEPGGDVTQTEAVGVDGRRRTEPERSAAVPEPIRWNLAVRP